VLLLYAGLISLNLHHFALYAEILQAFAALLGTLFFPEAEATKVELVDAVNHLQLPPAGAPGVDVGDEIAGLGGVEVLGEGIVAGLAEAEVAEGVVIDSIVADGGADAADVADVVEVGGLLVVEFVADGAVLFRAGGHSAVHTVKLVADSADRPAQLLLLAFRAVRPQHFIVGADEKLKLVAIQALVLLLQLKSVNFLGGNEGAGLVVVSELFEGHDGEGAVGGGIGAEELEGDVGDGLQVEGTAALVGADVVALLPVRNALHAVDPLAAALANEGLHADLEANSALVPLSNGF